MSGLWQKIDEGETGKPVVWNINVERNALYEGVIAKLFSLGRTIQKIQSVQAVDHDRKDTPLLGLHWFRMSGRLAVLSYQNGNILDPQDGNVWGAMVVASAPTTRS